jgi:hypothetical protein
MTNYIVNKTTTEVFAVVADSMIEATKTVEQGNGVAVNASVQYAARPQTPQQVGATPNITGFPLGAHPMMPQPLPPKVASKK